MNVVGNPHTALVSLTGNTTDSRFHPTQVNGTSYFHSRRNVASGSTRVALSAGKAQAAMATSKTNSVTAEKVRGSHGLTPNNICSSNRVLASAPATPTANPARVSFK